MPKTITVLYDDYVKLQSDLAKTQEELAETKKDLARAEGMREFEVNKYTLLLRSQGRGYAKELRSTIELELVTLRELADRIPGDDKRKFIRRLDRIDMYLEEFGREE